MLTGKYVGVVGVLPAEPAVPVPTRGPVLVPAGVAGWWALLGCVAPPIQQLFMFLGGSVHVQAPHGGGRAITLARLLGLEPKWLRIVSR